jgi:hypothetical protein
VKALEALVVLAAVLCILGGAYSALFFVVTRHRHDWEWVGYNGATDTNMWRCRTCPRRRDDG